MCSQSADAILVWVAGAAELLSLAPELPAVSAYGDFRPRNWLRDEPARRLAMIDFERLAGPAVSDLVRLEYEPWDQHPDLRRRIAPHQPDHRLLGGIRPVPVARHSSWRRRDTPFEQDRNRNSLAGVIRWRQLGEHLGFGSAQGAAAIKQAWPSRIVNIRRVLVLYAGRITPIPRTLWRRAPYLVRRADSPLL